METLDRRLSVQRAAMESDGLLLTREQHDVEMQVQTQDFDHYATSKSISQEMLNITGIQGLITMVVGLFALGRPLTGFQIALLVFIGLSLTLQCIIFIFLVVLAKSRTEKLGNSNCTATGLNSAVTSLSGLLLIVSSVVSILSIYATTTGGPAAPA